MPIVDARMTPAHDVFTASQLAAALGVSRKRAHQRMDSAKRAASVQAVRGVDSLCWPIAALPASVAADLRRIVSQQGYCSIGHLLAAPPQSWQPDHPLSALAPSAVEKAESRRNVLAPILAARDALVVPVSELVRRAGTAFTEAGDADAGGDRAVRRWIEEAIERDRGFWDWQRIEIYLDEKPPLKALHIEQRLALAEAGGDALALVLRNLHDGHPPSEQDRGDVWHAVFKRFCVLVDAGNDASKARRALFRILQKSKLPLFADTAAARSMAWARQFKKWDGGGRCPEAFVDGRAFNSKERRYQLTTEETKDLRYCVLLKDSLDLGVGLFIKRPVCLPATRALLMEDLDKAARRRRPVNWAMSLRRAAHVTVEEKAKFRGEKAFQNVEQVSHRGLWYPGSEGEKVPLRPNTIWESDDMSSNEPFSYLDPESGQILIGRQTLATQDVFSRSWLSAMPLGRARDAYRVEDQADHFLETVLVNGLPDAWRLERGVWENNMIDGIPLPDGTRWGGLRALFHVERTFKSRGKGGIESSFDFTQSLLAHESLSIGRKRGEFEKGTKAMMRAKAGDEKAALQFWSIGEYANGIHQAMKEFNATPKQRRAFGRDTVAPDDLYRGATRKECPTSELWRFCPIKKTATVRRGEVQVSVPYYPRPFSFRVNGEAGDRYFEHGYAVLIAFHPGHPERGCHVFNAERGAANRDNLQFGEFLLLAPFVDEMAQFGAAGALDRELLARKRANAAVTQEFRSIMGAAARISVVRDSYGQSVRRESGASAPSVVGADSIRNLKAQRAEKRSKQADEYQCKAAVDADALLEEVARKEAEMEAAGIFNP